MQIKSVNGKYSYFGLFLLGLEKEIDGKTFLKFFLTLFVCQCTELNKVRIWCSLFSSFYYQL